MPYRFALLLVAAGLAGSAAFLACSSDPAADGASCEDDDGCKSGTCVDGACAGRACACPSCANECDDGWTCSLRGSVPGLSCTKKCTTSSECPAGTHCSDGVCAAGKEISLTWVKKPGDAVCPLGLRCQYEVSAAGAGTGDIASYDWTFGDAGAAPGAGAAAEFAYPTAGLYDVTVSPALKNGRRGPSLQARERVCIDDPDTDCTPGTNDCCGGTCTAARRCR